MRLWSIDLAFPQGSALVVLSIVRERLDRDLQRHPLEAPVRRVEVEVTRTVPGQARQRDLFTNKEEELEGFQSVVARLTEKLGFERAFLAAPLESRLPERCWKKTLEAVPEFRAEVPPRPLRVLKKPQVVRRIENYLVHGRRRWKISAIRGPERLSGDWWFGDRERDYFRIEAESGEELWVFTSPGGDEYYLHGLFD
jgi:protein ImuB